VKKEINNFTYMIDIRLQRLEKLINNLKSKEQEENIEKYNHQWY